MFENYKDSLFINKTIMQSQQRFKSHHHNVYTEEVNNIALNSNDNKRLETFVRVTTYGANAFNPIPPRIFRVPSGLGEGAGGHKVPNTHNF